MQHHMLHQYSLPYLWQYFSAFFLEQCGISSTLTRCAAASRSRHWKHLGLSDFLHLVASVLQVDRHNLVFSYPLLNLTLTKTLIVSPIIVSRVWIPNGFVRFQNLNLQKPLNVSQPLNFDTYFFCWYKLIESTAQNCNRRFCTSFEKF